MKLILSDYRNFNGILIYSSFFAQSVIFIFHIWSVGSLIVYGVCTTFILVQARDWNYEILASLARTVVETCLKFHYELILQEFHEQLTWVK